MCVCIKENLYVCILLLVFCNDGFLYVSLILLKRSVECKVLVKLNL